MDLKKKLEKLKAASAQIEQKIIEQEREQNQILGQVFKILLDHQQIRAHVSGEAFRTKLSGKQTAALASAIQAKTIGTPENSRTSTTTDAGGVSVEPQPAQSAESGAARTIHS